MERNSSEKKLEIIFVAPFFRNFQLIRVLRKRYNVYYFRSFNKFKNIIENMTSQPNLVLIDEEYMSLEKNKKFIHYMILTYFIPIMILSKSKENLSEYISFGIKDIIHKPIIPEIFLNKIKNHMDLITEVDLYKRLSKNSYDNYQIELIHGKELESSIIELLVLITEFRIYANNKALGKIHKFMQIFLKALQLTSNPNQLEVLLWNINDHIIASQLYDIGKNTISDSILFKKGELTKNDIRILKGHIPNGIKLINILLDNKSISPHAKNIFSIAKKYISYHHEFFDGSGYPNHLNGKNIPLEGRIMCIIDNFNAITSERPYKNTISDFNTVLNFFKENSGIKFDKDLINVFFDIKEEFQKILL